jgi:hypothetical protein
MARKGVDYDTYYQDQEAMKGSEAARLAALRYSGGDPAVAMAMLERGQATGNQALRKSAVDRANFQAGQKQNQMTMLDKIGADRQIIDRGYNQDYVTALSNRDAALSDVQKNYLDEIHTKSKDYYTLEDRQTGKEILNRSHPGFYPKRMRKNGGRFKKYFK